MLGMCQIVLNVLSVLDVVENSCGYKSVHLFSNIDQDRKGFTVHLHASYLEPKNLIVLLICYFVPIVHQTNSLHAFSVICNTCMSSYLKDILSRVEKGFLRITDSQDFRSVTLLSAGNLISRNLFPGKIFNQNLPWKIFQKIGKFSKNLVNFGKFWNILINFEKQYSSLMYKHNFV